MTTTATTTTTPIQITGDPGPLFAALASAAAELTDVIKDSNAAKGGSFGYSYASLAAALRDTRPTLARHGLALVQMPNCDGDTLTVVTMLTHASGSYLSSALSTVLPKAERMSPLQSLGSAITYARRYSLLAILSLAAEDDDGSAGAAETSRRAPQPQAAPKPPAPKPITAAAHKRLEKLIGDAGLDRERIKAAVARAWPQCYPQAADVHLNKIDADQAAWVERKLPGWQAKAEAEKQPQRLPIDDVKDQLKHEGAWDGDEQTLGKVADDLEGFADRTYSSAQRADDPAARRRDEETAQQALNRARLIREYLASQTKSEAA